jgi:hypothetical protein
MQKSQNSRSKVFSYNFCLMMEGSGVGSGCVNLTKRIQEAQKLTDLDPEQ